jgi:hypothetical protein
VLVLSLVVSLLSVMGTALPAIVDLMNLPADTVVVFLDASKIDPSIDPTKRVIDVWTLNGGGSSAIVRSAKLILPHSQDVELEVGNLKDSLVPPKGKTTIRFLSERVDAVKGCSGGDIFAALAQGTAKLEVEIDERNRWGTFVRRNPPVHTDVPGVKLKDWLRDKTDVTATKGCS